MNSKRREARIVGQKLLWFNTEAQHVKRGILTKKHI